MLATPFRIVNFRAETELFSYLGRVQKDILEDVPGLETFKATLRKNGDFYGCLVSIKLAEGDYNGFGFDTDPMLAVSQAHEDLIEQLWEWSVAGEGLFPTRWRTVPQKFHIA